MPTSDVIFLLGSDAKLERVPYTPYSSEGLLQQLIAQHPELLSGEQIDPDDPPTWLLIGQETGVPDSDGASDRWAVDHLLLDQAATPTFVEVKRSTDTRIRREVVGQMLDYAANATRYWPVDRIRTLAAEQCGGVENLDREIERLIGCFEGDSERVDGYWSAVEDNLRTGSLRLLFVADEIPRELRRVIEFLNEHMRKIEVLGIEVRQYAHDSLRALVPRVIGQTERARQQHGSGARAKKTSEAEFLAQCPTWAHRLFEQILAEARSHDLLVNWGTKGFSIRTPTYGGRMCSLLYGYPTGAVGSPAPLLEVYLKDLEDLIDVAALRTGLVNDAGFRESGQYSLRTVLSEESIEKTIAGLPLIWEEYRGLRPAGE